MGSEPMSELSEARAREVSLGARHERLCRKFDRGEDVSFALRQAEIDWIRAKNALAALESAAS
jgi:hypothetical protein